MALLPVAQHLMIGLCRWCIKAGLWALSGFLVANVGAMALGAGQPEHPVLAGFTDGCQSLPQPCWNGIVPGLTTADEQTRIMASMAYVPVDLDGLVASYRTPFMAADYCQRVIFMRTTDGQGDIIVHEIILSECSNMQSGDVMRLFRRPSILSNATPILLYNEGSVRAIFTGSSRWQKAPFEPVEDLRLRAGGGLPLYDWHGFLPAWRYCQLEPRAPGCG